MNKPVVRVTLLESFRRYMSDKYTYSTEQDVIDSITCKFEGNSYTYIGSAFHRIVETGDTGKEVPCGERHFLYYGKSNTEPVPEGRKLTIDKNEVLFDIAQCNLALDYRKRYDGAFHEVREYKDYGRAIVTGCADMIHGVTIRDIKTKYSMPDDSDYIDSCQWRFYLDLFEADTFYFDLFMFDGYSAEKHGVDVRGLILKEYTPSIQCNRYSRMSIDNENLLNEFLEWAEYRDLVKFLIPNNYGKQS